MVRVECRASSQEAFRTLRIPRIPFFSLFFLTLRIPFFSQQRLINKFGTGSLLEKTSPVYLHRRQTIKLYGNLNICRYCKVDVNHKDVLHIYHQNAVEHLPILLDILVKLYNNKFGQ